VTAGHDGDVEVVIEELVLHGFEPGHRDAIADALRRELATQLVGWRPAAPSGIAHLDGGSFAVAAGTAPAVVGRDAGRELGRAVTAAAPAEPARGDVR
jgi:hypothetical protein